MPVVIDQMSEEPIYRQIRAQVIEAIATGELSPGDPLPSVRSLARDLGVNLHTVNKAYAVLRDEGYLIMRGRSGAFVADADVVRPRVISQPSRTSSWHVSCCDLQLRIGLAGARSKALWRRLPARRVRHTGRENPWPKEMVRMSAESVLSVVTILILVPLCGVILP